MKTDVSHFDRLPDGAMVPMTVLCAVLGIGVSTGWRRAKTEPEFPQPRRLGEKCTRVRVGDIRAFVTKRSGGHAK